MTDSLLQAHRILPAPQGTAIAILQASRSGESSLQEIITLVQADPVLTTRLQLFAVHSASLSLQRQPLEQTLAALGPVAIKNLALAFSLMDQYSTGLCINFDYKRFWCESLLMAFVMKNLVKLAAMEGAQPMGSWALLSRMGCLCVATAHPIQYSKLLRSPVSDAALLAMEQKKLDTDHLSLGLALLRDWGLADALVGPLMLHEEDIADSPETLSGESFLNSAMQLAYQVARHTCRPEYADADIFTALTTFSKRADISMAALLQDIRQAVEQSLVCTKLLGLELCAMTPDPLIGRLAVPANDTPDSPLKILIIEDDPILKRLLQTWLKVEIGHTLIGASNGEEALVLAEHHLPQVIITDWRMPVMDGIEFCKALRKTEWGVSMYVLMLTSNSDNEDLVRAFEAGVDDFQSKPLNRQAMGARLRAAWRYVQLRNTWMKDNERLQLANTHLERTVRQLQLSSMKDELTDLANRRAGQVAIAQSISTAQRHGMQMCVIGLDLDFFKLLNTSAGRESADEVLQLVAVTLQQAARVEDTVCRWVGDEFLIVAPGLRLQEGIAAAKRFRGLIANHRISLELLTVGVTVSVGVACWDSESKAKEQLLIEVDQALDTAKHAGGNRVAVFDQGITRLA